MIGIIEEPLLRLVPKSFDYVGDVAVISIPPELTAYKEVIASKLQSMRGNTQAVLNKISKLEGEHRVAEFELLLGESTETFHKENGYTYKLDIKKVFFNPRLYSERGRIAAKINPEEHVLIPFAGVGPFVLPAAGKGAKVYAVEINPDACICLRENIRINRLEKKVIIIQGNFENITDVKDIQLPENGFDRAIVPTPYGMDHALVEVSKFVKKGGNIHFYTFKAESQLTDLIKDYEKMGLEVEFYRRRGNVAPGISRWVFDFVKK
jgi:tRNA (guanine37-N1)-methyltransferase